MTESLSSTASISKHKKPPQSLAGCQKCYICKQKLQKKQSNTLKKQIIKCQSCKSEAHKYCYWPSSPTTKIKCDTCLFQNYQRKSIVCCVCQQPGHMMKKIANSDKKFGHVICLLFSAYFLVESYERLRFFQVTQLCSKNQIIKAKCFYCHQQTTTENSWKCAKKNCNERVHFRCVFQHQIIQNQDEDQQQYQIINSIQNKDWKNTFTSLSVSQKPRINLIAYFKKLENYIKWYFKQHLDRPQPQKPQENLISQNMVISCPAHEREFPTPSCQCNKQQPDSLIFCDSCQHWNHIKCQHLNNFQVPESYKCVECRDWEAILKKRKKPILQVYPNLYIYDYIYIQAFFQKNFYVLNQKQTELLTRLIIAPSMAFYNNFIQIYMMKQLNSQIYTQSLRKCIKSKKFQYSQQNIKAFKYVKILLSSYINFERLKQQFKKISSKEQQISIEQVKKLLKQYDKKVSKKKKAESAMQTSFNIQVYSQIKSGLTRNHNKSKNKDKQKDKTLKQKIKFSKSFCNEPKQSKIKKNPSKKIKNQPEGNKQSKTVLNRSCLEVEDEWFMEQNGTIIIFEQYSSEQNEYGKRQRPWQQNPPKMSKKSTKILNSAMCTPQKQKQKQKCRQKHKQKQKQPEQPPKHHPKTNKVTPYNFGYSPLQFLHHEAEYQFECSDKFMSSLFNRRTDEEQITFQLIFNCLHMDLRQGSYGLTAQQRQSLLRNAHTTNYNEQLKKYPASKILKTQQLTKKLFEQLRKQHPQLTFIQNLKQLKLTKTNLPHFFSFFSKCKQISLFQYTSIHESLKQIAVKMITQNVKHSIKNYEQIQAYETIYQNYRQYLDALCQKNNINIKWLQNFLHKKSQIQKMVIGQKIGQIPTSQTQKQHTMKTCIQIGIFNRLFDYIQAHKLHFMISKVSQYFQWYKIDQLYSKHIAKCHQTRIQDYTFRDVRNVKIDPQQLKNIHGLIIANQYPHNAISYHVLFLYQKWSGMACYLERFLEVFDRNIHRENQNSGYNNNGAHYVIKLDIQKQKEVNQKWNENDIRNWLKQLKNSIFDCPILINEIEQILIIYQGLIQKLIELGNNPIKMQVQQTTLQQPSTIKNTIPSIQMSNIFNTQTQTNSMIKINKNPSISISQAIPKHSPNGNANTNANKNSNKQQSTVEQLLKKIKIIPINFDMNKYYRRSELILEIDGELKDTVTFCPQSKI